MKISASVRDGTIINVIRGTNTKTSNSKCFPQKAFVTTTITVHTSLNNSITSIEESRIARLQRECVNEQVKEYNVAPLLSWIEQVSRETVFVDERIVSVDEYVTKLLQCRVLR